MLRLLFWTTVTFIASCRSGDSPTVGSAAFRAPDPLPSWQDGETKRSILDFIARTTDPGSASFIPEADRIACFDNDGTLWAEQPVYFQLLYAIDRIRATAADHPEWTTTEPFRSLLAGDMDGVADAGENGLAAIVMGSHADMPVDTFSRVARSWIDTATHPVTGRLIKDMVYQPMLELLHFLRARGFKTFIVSGGGIDFLRAWAEDIYGIPPYQVIGSSIKTRYGVRNGRPELTKIPELDFIDDKEGKVAGIHRHIGKRPVFTAGNSDGDVPMLQYTLTGDGYPRFGLIIHHTDSIREYAYDRDSHIGRLRTGLDSAAHFGWHLVDMAADWKRVYPAD